LTRSGFLFPAPSPQHGGLKRGASATSPMSITSFFRNRHARGHHARRGGWGVRRFNPPAGGFEPQYNARVITPSVIGNDRSLRGAWASITCAALAYAFGARQIALGTAATISAQAILVPQMTSTAGVS